MISEIHQFSGVFSKKEQNNQIYDTLKTLIFRIKLQMLAQIEERNLKLLLWIVTLIICNGKETLSGRWGLEFLLTMCGCAWWHDGVR